MHDAHFYKLEHAPEQTFQAVDGIFFCELAVPLD